jgi:hypothetical protein
MEITVMLTDFFSRALAAGIGLALVAGPLGCFVVWRRMAYFGDTMAHSALLGVALSILLSLNMTLGVFAVAALVAGALLLLQRQATLSTDALLGILSHSTLAVGLVLVGFLTTVRIDLMGFLFGDILAVSIEDIIVIYAGGAAILLILALGWRPLLASTVSGERGRGIAARSQPHRADDPHGQCHRHCHEACWRPAHHFPADHPGSNGAPAQRHARADGVRCGGAGHCRRGGGALRIKNLGYRLRPFDRGHGSGSLRPVAGRAGQAAVRQEGQSWHMITTHRAI